MATASEQKSDDLRAIKERLRANKLTTADLKRLEGIILDVERASKALRAAMIE